MMLRSIVWFCLCTMPLMAATPGGFFNAFELLYTGQLLTYTIGDVNNDGRKDILIFTRRRSTAGDNMRWLTLYLQRDSGFATTPDQSVRVPHDLILFDIGDVSGDALPELVYFAPGAIRCLRFGPDGLNMKPEILLEVESIFALASQHQVRTLDFVRDFNGDGVEDLLIPQMTQTQLYYRDIDAGSWKIISLPLRTETRVYAHFDARYSVGHHADALYTTPYLVFDDFDGDGRRDLIGVYNDSLVAFAQGEDGYFTTNRIYRLRLDYGEIWRGAKIQRTHLDDKSEKRHLMRLEDINGDGILDIVGIRFSTQESLINPKNDVRIYYGRRNATNGGPQLSFATTPDQIIKPDGTMMVLDILDINFDGRDDLIIPMVKIGVTQIIKMLLTQTVTVEAAQYLMGADGRYPDKPDGKNALNVKFSFKGGAASPVYEIADFNGDGKYDILSSSDEQRLLLYWGKAGNLFQSSVGENFAFPLPQDGTRVRADDLNGDGRSDVIIAYDEDDFVRKKLPRALQVLITKP